MLVSSGRRSDYKKYDAGRCASTGSWTRSGGLAQDLCLLTIEFRARMNAQRNSTIFADAFRPDDSLWSFCLVESSAAGPRCICIVIRSDLAILHEADLSPCDQG